MSSLGEAVTAIAPEQVKDAVIGETCALTPAVTMCAPGTKSLGTRIRTLREAGGLTQTDLAVALGLSKATVSAWETGSSNLKLQTFLRILDVLGVAEPEYLIRGTDW